jgi:dTDP-glucose pyrophosphorylase
VWLKDTKDTNHTVALLNENSIKRFVEKPNYPAQMSALVATGMYMLQPHLNTYIKNLPRNNKGENNMSDLGNKILSLDGTVGRVMMQGNWYDIGNQEIRKEAEERFKC